MVQILNLCNVQNSWFYLKKAGPFINLKITTYRLPPECHEEFVYAAVVDFMNLSNGYSEC
jgi:hypothetical protein